MYVIVTVKVPTPHGYTGEETVSSVRMARTVDRHCVGIGVKPLCKCYDIAVAHELV